MGEAGAVDLLSAAVRVLAFIAVFQAAGGVIFLALYGRSCGAAAPAIGREVRRAALIASGLVALHYLLAAGRMGGNFADVLDPALQGLALRTPVALAAACQLTGLLLMVTALADRSRRLGAAALPGVLLTLAAFLLTGHTVDSHPRAALAAVLLGHLTAVAFWFGALRPLWLLAARGPAAVSSAVVTRFSAQAVWIVPALLLAGLTLAGRLLSGPAALREPYGRLLLVKLGGFSLLMLLAAANRWRYGPALARHSAARAFRVTVACEYGLLAVILGVTAVLTDFFSPA